MVKITIHKAVNGKSAVSKNGVKTNVNVICHCGKWHAKVGRSTFTMAYSKAALRAELAQIL